jgi:demethylmenaquinone methyltransferase/2-methoxy-6-polyprenyl-1,4-benzoquinol methylase
MFDRIARRYDLVNTLVSAGLDQRWRRHAAALALPRPGSVLDIACGTGTLTAILARRTGGHRVVGADISDEMLRVGRRRHPGITFVHADAEALPFVDSEFDASTMGFGLRNLVDPLQGLREMARVSARMVVLEFLRPDASPIGRLQRYHLEHVVMRVGGMLTGDREAYCYLRDTVIAYHSAPELLDLAREAGWRDAGVTPLTLGTVALLHGRR